MGNVIPIQAAARVAADPVVERVDRYYAQLGALPGFLVRKEQKQLSVAMAKALLARKPLAAEAPTGTGKTIAYLIGAITAVDLMQASKDTLIVVATATVGLQSQVLLGDIPRLYDAGILKEGSAVLAKGRGRYFCRSNAERVLDGKAVSKQNDFFDESKNQEVVELNDVSEMLEQWVSRKWCGDSDAYQQALPASWGLVKASSDTCVGHKCDFYKECPFFAARRQLSSARVVVANHDLVLADLEMDRIGADPLFAGSQYIVIFDEAHHLPDKALEMGAAKLSFSEVLAELPKVHGYAKAWSKSPDLMRVLSKAKVEQVHLDPTAALNALKGVRDEAALLAVDPETLQHRFAQGVLPAGLSLVCNLAYNQVSNLFEAMKSATHALKNSDVAEKRPELKQSIAEMMFMSASFNGMLDRTTKALMLFASKRRAVRWAFVSKEEISLHCSPLEGAEVLKELLWDNSRAIVGMTSATLQDFNGFHRFKTRAGTPTDTRTVSLPHVFPYQENEIHLVKMLASPRFSEKEDFTKELIALLPKFIWKEESTLVLFPSRAMMNQVVPHLRKHFDGHMMVQGEKGIKELIADHKACIDNGKGNILCGMATLAEGLDLPGHYCTHVVICALPFTAPTSPVEQELQEMLGADYFLARALPDALVRLVQMVGRLMRRESDRGRITIFDNRLGSTKWGRRMLQALPPFKKLYIEPSQPPLRVLPSPKK